MLNEHKVSEQIKVLKTLAFLRPSDILIIVIPINLSEKPENFVVLRVLDFVKFFSLE